MADSLHPLTDGERIRLKAAFSRYDNEDRDSRLTHILYSTGMHPTCLGNPPMWRMAVGEKLLTWERAKTRSQVTVPIDPDIRPWLADMIAALSMEPIHRVKVNEAVARFGTKAGVPGLTPRGLRHDFGNRAVQSRGFIEARELTGTTTRILMGYARRRIAEDAANDPRGLFG